MVQYRDHDVKEEGRDVYFATIASRIDSVALER